MGNHLSGESSPYLLQHAGNPVNWYPWGPEALAKARLEDKPIFLSIGYSACHWCHVMERESFEDEDVAALLNEHFVSIKVDREERPDLDAVYMQAVQSLTGQGGWPLSAWLTPEGSPFYGGTYFPPTSRQGLPSFRQVLQAVAQAWASRRADVNNAASAVRDHLRQQMITASGGITDNATAAPNYATILDAADRELHGSVDRRDGGWGGAPKFPQPMVLEYLLARRTVDPDPQVETDIEITLDAMAAGGMYDHLGGGFHRYSTDGHWLVPHFEKMLYDNAQLARCYAHGWQSLGKPRYRTVAEQTLDYLLREMQHPLGGFYSAQDADTPEGEGAFFTWTPEEMRAALSPEEAAVVMRTYGLTAGPNFEGRNILHLPAGFPTPGRPEPATGEVLDRGRAKLLAVRETRPQPARDEKILAGWNGLAIAALADAATAFGTAPYREAAERAAQFVLDEMTTGGSGAAGADVRLLHSWKDGRTSGDAFLDDHACVAEGLLALYRCTFDERWFVAARGLVDGLLGRFSKPGGGFFDTGEDHEVLIARPRAAFDSPTPTGTSMAATVLLKMAAYTGEAHYRDRAEEALASLTDAATAAPVMTGQWLTAALLAKEQPVEVAVVGDLEQPAGAALLEALRKGFRPLVVAAARPADAPTAVPILLDREPRPGVAAEAWVCRHSVCSAPTADPACVAELLGGAQSAP